MVSPGSFPCNKNKTNKNKNTELFKKVKILRSGVVEMPCAIKIKKNIGRQEIACKKWYRHSNRLTTIKIRLLAHFINIVILKPALCSTVNECSWAGGDQAFIEVSFSPLLATERAIVNKTHKSLPSWPHKYSKVVQRNKSLGNDSTVWEELRKKTTQGPAFPGTLRVLYPLRSFWFHHSISITIISRNCSYHSPEDTWVLLIFCCNQEQSRTNNNVSHHNI